MSRYIDADALYEKTAEWEAQALHMVEIHSHDEDNAEWKRWSTILTARSAFKFDIADFPSVDVVEHKRGEWIERNVTQDRRDAKIPEWQSAKCSVCGKYHTTPYMYYFTNYDYCPNCGADMRGDEDEIQGKK